MPRRSTAFPVSGTMTSLEETHSILANVIMVHAWHTYKALCTPLAAINVNQSLPPLQSCISLISSISAFPSSISMASSVASDSNSTKRSPHVSSVLTDAEVVEHLLYCAESTGGIPQSNDYRSNLAMYDGAIHTLMNELTPHN